MRKKIRAITLLTFSMIIGISVSFTGCNKESMLNPKNEAGSELKQVIDTKAKVGEIYCYLCISEKGWKGEGSRPEKICVNGKNRCWIWFQETIECDCRSNVASVTPIKEDAIVLDFPYKINKEKALKELFDLEKGVFVIEEDIIEEKNSYLSELMNSPLTYIPAGTYPLSKYTEGIKVVLPVIAK